jgi:hypothetical protein
LLWCMERMAGCQHMALLNLHATWIAILAGFIAGAISGLRFYDDEWLGGYSSWRRRMVRLAHISFFGLALINLAFVFTVKYLNLPEQPWTSWLFIVGLVTMPVCCYLSALNKVCRHLFVLPVGSLLGGCIVFLVAGVFK